MNRSLTLTVVAAVVLAACGGSSESGEVARKPAPSTAPSGIETEPPPPSTTAPPFRNTVATANVPEVNVFESPAHTSPGRTLANPQPPYGTPLVLLVRESAGEWLNVLLPVRPNGSTGWIRQSEVTLSGHDYRMVVELGAHRITAYEGDQVILQEPVGIGTAETPTPGGLYYTKELLQPLDDAGQPLLDGPYGPYVYVLSGFSEVLFNFAGGEGVIGIHGTNAPSGLGRDVSAGCIRMSNEAITRMAGTLGAGIPVEILA